MVQIIIAEILKKIQTILTLLFEYKELFRTIFVFTLTIYVMVLNYTINRGYKIKNVNDKTNKDT